MKRTAVAVSVAVVLCMFSASRASAQVMFSGTGPVHPKIEVGADLSVLNLMGLAGTGAHITRHYGKRIAVEASVTGAATTPSVPGHSLIVINARLQEGRPNSSRQRFLTFGLARASGLSYSYSPMVGLGGQSLSAKTFGAVRLGFRVDLQYFPRGETLYGRGRLGVGIVAAF